MKLGYISVYTAKGWEPWGIGTFSDAVRAKIETGARLFHFVSLGRK